MSEACFFRIEAFFAADLAAKRAAEGRDASAPLTPTELYEATSRAGVNPLREGGEFQRLVSQHYETYGVAVARGERVALGLGWAASWRGGELVWASFSSHPRPCSLRFFEQQAELIAFRLGVSLDRVAQEPPESPGAHPTYLAAFTPA